MDCLERIRTLLEERGWSVYRLAQEAGVPQSTLANLFLRNNMPTVPTLERICQALGITMAEFFSQQPTLPPEEELTAQLLEEWAALPRHQGLELYAGLALYKAGTDADGGTWLLRDNIIALQAEAALNGGYQGVILYSSEYLEAEQTAKEVENAAALLGQY